MAVAKHHRLRNNDMFKLLNKKLKPSVSERTALLAFKWKSLFFRKVATTAKEQPKYLVVNKASRSLNFEALVGQGPDHWMGCL